MLLNGLASGRFLCYNLSHEERASPNLLRQRQSGLRVRQYFHGRLDQAGTARGNLFELPSFLYRQAKTRGHGRPRREIPEAPADQQDRCDKTRGQAGKVRQEGREAGRGPGRKVTTKVRSAYESTKFRIFVPFRTFVALFYGQTTRKNSARIRGDPAGTVEDHGTAETKRTWQEIGRHGGACLQNSGTARPGAAASG